MEKIYEWADQKIVHYGLKHIFTFSKLTQGQIFNLYKIKALVIQPGVDTDFLNQKTPGNFETAYKLNQTFNILQVGQFNYEKNQLLTIDVFQKIRQKVPQAKLILIGDGPLRTKIEEKIKEFKLEKDVILTGRLPLNSSLFAAFYRKASVLVFPSLIQSWGLVPFEALGFGVVPLVSENSGCADVIKRERIGLVMKPNPNDYYRKLIYIYENQKEMKKIATKGRKYTLDNLTYEAYSRKFREQIWKLR